MLAEKLLLSLLIVIFPNLIHGYFNDVNKNGTPASLYAILQGTASLLCLVFSYSAYGLHWDLRCIPLVLAFVYGGRRAGLFVLGVILIGRTIMAGDSLVFAYASCIASAVLPLALANKTQAFSAKKRATAAFILGMWPAMLTLLFFLLYAVFYRHLVDLSLNSLKDILLFGAIHIIALVSATWINEAVRDRQEMKRQVILAEKIMAQGELAASIAHEIRNPLTVVKGFLQLMREGSRDSKDVGHFNLVLDELARAEGIITEFLDYSKPRLEHKEEFSLASTAFDLVTLLEPLALKHGLDLACDIEASPVLYTDEKKLKMALLNLLKNAIEATPSGGKVSIRIAQDKQTSQIVIRDNGKGMTREQLQHLGTVYYSLKEKGTGIGTMVAMKILKEMGAKVVYKSELNAGTEVSIAMPVVR